MASYAIEQILKNRNITDYLASKGIYPVGGLVNGKLKYRCPIHGETSPSFYVYLNSEYQNFFCYGCKSRYNIIHLYKIIERVSTGNAIKALGRGLEFDLNSEIDHAVQEIEHDQSISKEYNVADLALITGTMMRDFLKEVNNDSVAIESTEKMFRIIDLAIETNDVQSLKILDDTLPEILQKKVIAYRDEQEKLELEVARLNQD